MNADVERTIRLFREIFYKGIPIMLQQNDTAFLSFMCVVAAIDALAAYRYEDKVGSTPISCRILHALFPRHRCAPGGVGERFRKFVREYFRPAYQPHAQNLYVFRCRILHNFSPAYFSVGHAQPGRHLQRSDIGDHVLDDGTFFADMRAAAEKYFAEVATSADLQAKMAARIADINRGGAIYF